MKEYSGILGPAARANGIDESKIAGNKYYQDHLKALELQRLEELQDKKDMKIKIMQQADQMQYDDDFDEEDNLYGNKNKSKYSVNVVKE